MPLGAAAGLLNPLLTRIRGPLPESEHDIIGVAHDDHVAVRLPLTPHPDPRVERVVEIDVRQQRRSGGT